MPVEMDWLVPNTIFVATFVGDISGLEHTDAMKTFIHHLDVATQPVHVIIDWRKVTHQAFLLEVLSTAQTVLRHPNMGWIATVGLNPLTTYWVSAISALVQFRNKAFSSPEAALSFLQSLPVQDFASTDHP
ncbi:MAG TPA: hypothetical protein VKQ72_15790 [Aggregatilineales bacterium]|nr:hypothetical protein [Aggregatilineales bacterium]